MLSRGCLKDDRGRPGRLGRVAPWLQLGMLAALACGGCAGPERRVDRIAEHAGLEPLMLSGLGFRHRAYAADRADETLLVIFIDGDGTPWVQGGRRIAADPTPRHPVALELAARTASSVLYLGRPCYFGIADRTCSSKYWTF